MTNWYVITGGPSSGKTTTVDMLHGLGYTTTIEHARHYLDLKRVEGKTVEEVRALRLEFQHGVLAMQLEQEASLDPEATIFLDHAIPDSLAYYRFLDIQPDAQLLDALRHVSYRKTFILDPPRRGLRPYRGRLRATARPCSSHRGIRGSPNPGCESANSQPGRPSRVHSGSALTEPVKDA